MDMQGIGRAVDKDMARAAMLPQCHGDLFHWFHRQGHATGQRRTGGVGVPQPCKRIRARIENCIEIFIDDCCRRCIDGARAHHHGSYRHPALLEVEQLIWNVAFRQARPRVYDAT